MKFPHWLPVYGDTDFRGKCPTESLEQITFFARIRKAYPDTYGLTAIHPRNEGKRTHNQTMRIKAEGLTAGSSDIVIPGKTSFVCELKRRDHTKSKWQDGQREFLFAAYDTGSYVCAALGCDAAFEAFEFWEKNVNVG